MFIKLCLLYNLKKVRINTETERLYFQDKHADKLKVNVSMVGKKIDKLDKQEKKTDKEVIKLSRMQNEVQEATQAKTQLKEFKLKEEYFAGLSKTIKKNLWM